MMTGTQTLLCSACLRKLVACGIMPADSYVCGFDFGFEIGRNSGRATLSDIAWKWEWARPHVGKQSPSHRPIKAGIRRAVAAGLAFRRACLREVDGVTRNKRCRADSRYLDDVVRRHKCRFVRHDLLGRVAVPSKNDEVPPPAVW
jgi:hypothetical protein